MPISSYSYIISPLVALAAVGLIVLICRWVFSTSSRDRRAAAAALAPRPGDWGLLVPVSTAPTAQEAAEQRAVLARAGLRATVSTAPGGEHALLVFPQDLPRAREVLVP